MAVRKFKPVTPGQRHKVIGTFEEITASVPEKSLVFGKRSTGGRNNTGKMTVRYMGGGHKRKYRIIDFKREKEHGIELYMKYSGMRKEAEKKTDKNQFTRAQLQPNENDEIICPAGHKFTLMDTRIERRGEYTREIEMYRNEHCESCPLREKCTKSKQGRTLQRCRELEDYKNEVKKNLSTDQGKKYMTLRSILAEGIFGQIKEDHHYDRLRRRGISGVKTEILLVCIGHNLRKYHTRKMESKKSEVLNQKIIQWKSS